MPIQKNSESFTKKLVCAVIFWGLLIVSIVSFILSIILKNYSATLKILPIILFNIYWIYTTKSYPKYFK